jgi:hypothetical protein
MATQKMNISKLSDDDLQDMFSESFEKNIASQNGFDSYECICKRDNSNSDVKMEVLMVGMAGSPTIEDYKAGKVKNSASVVINREDKGSLNFKFVPSETMIMNTNDYVVVYKAV